MGLTEQIFKGSVDRSMVEGKHLLGICPPNISHWAKSFTEIEISMPVSVSKDHGYNVPLDIVRQYVRGVGSYEINSFGRVVYLPISLNGKASLDHPVSSS